MNEEQLGEIQPGEILVAPFTAASWIAVFHVVCSVVTNMREDMAHAVIMGREFGIPVVTGTLEGVGRIKTGQKVRVDGNNMSDYIL